MIPADITYTDAILLQKLRKENNPIWEIYRWNDKQKEHGWSFYSYGGFFSDDHNCCICRSKLRRLFSVMPLGKIGYYRCPTCTKQCIQTKCAEVKGSRLLQMINTPDHSNFWIESICLPEKCGNCSRIANKDLNWCIDCISNCINGRVSAMRLQRRELQLGSSYIFMAYWRAGKRDSTNILGQLPKDVARIIAWLIRDDTYDGDIPTALRTYESITV